MNAHFPRLLRGPQRPSSRLALPSTIGATRVGVETIIFAGSVTAALVFALTFVSRRILFSATLIALLVATIVIASDVKRHYIEMVLHAYDVVFYLTSWSTVVYLWVDHKLMLLALDWNGLRRQRRRASALAIRRHAYPAKDQRRSVCSLRLPCYLVELRQGRTPEHAFLLG